MDRRDFIRLGSSGVALAMMPLSGCSTTSLPSVDQAQGPLAIAADGTRYELRPNAHQLVIDGRAIGGLGTAPGMLNYPIRVATASGVAYVVECGNHRVQAFDKTGSSLALIGVGELLYPKGVAIAGTELLVADSRNGRIAGFDPDGDLTNSYGAGVLSAPCGIVSLGDTMLVADPGLRQVVELDRSGRIVRTFDGDFVLPYDVAWDGSNAFVVDASSAAISVHDRSGRKSGSIELDAAATFLSFAADGTLYAG